MYGVQSRKGTGALILLPGFWALPEQQESALLLVPEERAFGDRDAFNSQALRFPAVL